MVRDLSDPSLNRTDPPSESHIDELERTLAALREDAEVMHVLLGLSSALAEVRTVEETFEKTVRMAAEVFGADRCFAAELDSASDTFTIRATFGFDGDLQASLGEMAREPGGLALLRHALDQKSPLLVPDTSSEERFTEDQMPVSPIGAYIGVPLSRGDENFGGVGVVFERPRLFSTKDIALARGIARQVGVALTNARRFSLLQGLRSLGLRIGRSGLSVAAVTREVATGALDLLAADAALVYFLDPERGQLVAGGGVGLDPDDLEKVTFLDVREKDLSPLLHGETVSMTDSELHRAIGMNSVVGVPIGSARTETPGAVLLFFKRWITLGRDEAEALHVVAAQASTALENAQRFERQRRVARSLQEALLSVERVDVDDFEFGAVYEAASTEADVGGDFFDVFDLPDGSIGIVVGDVSGKGAEAAALTAMAKYMLRAFAMRDSSPSSVLYHLNNALCKGLAEDRFVTVVYALVDAESKTALVAAAGHPAPMLFRASSGEVESVETAGGILGAFENQQFPHATVTLGGGDTFLTFTDGLIEARFGEGFFGRERVVESFTAHAPALTGGALARQIYEDASAFGTIADDTVVFVFTCGSAD